MDNNEYDEIHKNEEQDEVQYDNLTSEENSYEAINNRQRYIENETTQENQRRSLRPNILNMIGRNNDVSKAIKNKMDNLNQRNQIEKDKKEESEKDKPDKDSEDAKQEKKSENKTKNKVNLNNIKSVISADNETRKKLLQKKIIAFIMKNPWVLVIILSLFLLLLILIIILGGAGGADDNDYDISRSINNACSEFPLNSTDLSKSEFVSLMQKNITKYNAPNEFKNTNDLETIYSVATKNNCNPELVVSRAIQEGFTGGKYNYWGIAVYNGDTVGNGYNSLSEGVIAFCNIVNSYKTFYDLNHAYSYIGNYWANAGNNSYGGCTFIDFTYQYYDNKSRADAVKSVCAKNECPLSGKSPKNPSKCLKTNEEDQDAYTKYLNWALSNHRKNVFGLEPEQCINSNSDFGNFDKCTIFNQFDPNWLNRNLGFSDTKMNKGCAVTSVSIGISCFGNNYDATFNPAKFLDVANSSKYVNSCFTGANIYWTCPAIQTFAPNITYIDGIDKVLGSNIDYKVNFINSFDPNKHFFIVQIINEKTSTHFVVLKSINREKGTFTCLNPGGGTITEEKLKDINAIRVFTK